MAASYFPIDYFNYAVYGLSTGNTTQPSPSGDNTIMNLLDNIANGLSDLLEADRTVIYADSEFPSDPPSREPVVIEVFPRLVQTNPIITDPATSSMSLVHLDFSVRVTLRSWQPLDYAPIIQVMTNLTRYLTGNSYGQNVSNQSRVEKMSVREMEPGVHQIFVLAQASAIA